MSATAQMPGNPPPHPSLMEEEDWIHLIDQIKQGNVIPVIGPDLVRVPLDGKLVTYEHYVAQQLAQRPEYNLTTQDFRKPLGLSEEDLERPLAEVLERATLNDVIAVCVKKIPAKWPINLHTQVWQIVNSAQQLPVPPALTQLAQITDFDLFVTSTFDPMLERALGGQETNLTTGSYKGSLEDDIEDPEKARKERRRLLYYLFGKAEKTNYHWAICEVEILRLLVKLHDGKYRPTHLFDELRQKHLLLLGVNFRDWLARFFLWLAKNREILPNRELKEYLADTRVSNDTPLVLFLDYFSDTTTVVRAEPEDFVAELHQRWSAEAPLVTPPAPQPTTSEPPAEMPQKAVFLSYSRGDQAAVETLYGNLTRESIPVWYDATELGAGDLWKVKVRQYINSCRAFIPVVSSNALRLDQSEFRAEWKQAVDLESLRYGG